MQLKDAIEKVLRAAGKPLDAREITGRILAEGLWQTNGKTPAATVGAAIYMDIKNGGTIFVKAGKGKFALSGAAKRVEEPTLFDYAAREAEGKAKSSGYVYILTNPSLKGMVKIGKTRRPVNTRSKELYNTAIPTEFVEFASLKTSKYAQVEELVHRILTKLTHKRVNEKREFYKIKPQEALEILTDVSAVLDPDDRWFHVPGQDVVVKLIRGEKSEASVRKAESVQKSTAKGETWSGKTQLARLIAKREGKPGSFGHILLMFADKGSKNRRRCGKNSEWRKPLEDAGVKFDKDDFVSNWKCAKNPL